MTKFPHGWTGEGVRSPTTGGIGLEGWKAEDGDGGGANVTREIVSI